MSPAWSAAAALLGYLLGSLPFGYIVARAHGVDIFKVGSGNPGATNVKRVLGEKFGAKGKRAGNLVFALEALNNAFKRMAPDVTLTSTTGASGSLTAQIKNGAPFDVFLSADTD